MEIIYFTLGTNTIVRTLRTFVENGFWKNLNLAIATFLGDQSLVFDFSFHIIYRENS
jgi:hypothetical protein